jgi:phospholipid/cholesterol/gamma-HCH transport system substrate-binding protein
VSQAVYQSLDDVKQLLHTGPTAFQNFLNIYQPTQVALTGALGVNQFSNTVQFLCGAIQAASRLGSKDAAKLCVQYLSPIIKNRQYNFLPLGLNPFVGTSARPNEVTYSEDWLRPDYVPPPPGSAPGAPTPPGNTPPPPPGGASPLAAEAPAPPAPAAQPSSTNPADGLRGMMTLPGGGH